VCFFVALSTDTPKQVLYEIADQLSIDTAGSETLEQLVKGIRDYSLQKLDQGKNCIVVIDDAHLFEQPVLEQLYQLTLNDGDQRCAISLLLCGQQSLLELMQAVIPAEAVAKVLFHQQVSPLSYDEMVQYLKIHFKENAGHSKPPFSEADYQQIFQQSGGLPGRVNEQAKRVLTAGVSRLVDNVENSKKPKGFTVLLAIILLVVAGAFWWQNDQQMDSDVDVTRLGMTGQIERSDEIQNIGEDELAEEQIFAAPEQPLAEQDGSELVMSEAPAEMGQALSAIQGSDILAQPLASTASDLIDEKLLIETVVAPSTVVATQQEVVEGAVSEPETLEVIEPGSKVPRQQTSVVQLVLPSSKLLRDTERILAIDESEYTMQLLGSHKEESITVILSKLPDDNNLMYFEKTHKGAPWYVLIYGHYADRTAANTATKKLPAALKGIKPWVRRVSAIQDTISARQ